jgi:hypothetical protein
LAQLAQGTGSAARRSCLVGLRRSLARIVARTLSALFCPVRQSKQGIAENPVCGTALKESLAGLHGHQIGRFPVVYRLAGDLETAVVMVGPRSRIVQESYPDRLEGEHLVQMHQVFGG